ncbi:DUF6530 family protein [Enterococcus sp. DIV0876]|uniref:DUF6530 family protein n=1 Tax=Enterococcus sp. DIV0876 TaxID=2774633 RepID=UPI003D2FD1FC
MKLPEDHQHQSVIKVEKYDQIDGRNALQTDAKALSLGLDPAKDPNDIMGKIWHENSDSSLSSEELPLTRILDMAILTAQSSLYFQEAYRHEKFYDPENPLVDIIGLQGNRMTVEVDTDNPNIDEDILTFYDTLQKNGELIGERFKILKRLLEDLGY